jgi:DNA invertase Pin-like site-specific DNA recombinase
MDTTSTTGKLLLGVLASLAEFETDIRKERQREGLIRLRPALYIKAVSPL